MQEKTLGYLTHHLSVSMQRALNLEFLRAGYDVQQSQYVILRYLFKNDDVCQQMLSEVLDKDAAAIKRSIDILEKKGLVVRIAATKRKNYLKLTAKANEIIPAIVECADSVLRKVRENISEEHYEIFLRTIDIMIENTKCIGNEKKKSD